MLGFCTRAVTGIALLAAACSFPSVADAQFFGSAPIFGGGPYPAYRGYAPVAYGGTAYGYGMGDPCNPCAQAAPVAMQTASLDCPCMRPVTETVYKEIDAVEYRTVEKPVKVAKVVTEMVDREVVTYQTVNEVKTVQVPSYVNQTVQECRQVSMNNSYWQTTWQPVPKMSPCLYDGRPGLIGELNRLGYAFRNSITPNAYARREYVPNVVAYNVPVQRTVQIPTTREVSYTVSRQVPVTTVQKVPVQRTVWEDTMVTVQEPYTVKKTVAVGTQTRMVYDSNFGGPQTAAEPTPATTAGGSNSQSAGTSKGTTKLQSYDAPEVPVQTPIYRREVQPTPAATPAPTPDVPRGPVASSEGDSPSIVRVATWQATRRSGEPAPATVQGPELIARKN